MGDLRPCLLVHSFRSGVRYPRSRCRSVQCHLLRLGEKPGRYQTIAYSHRRCPWRDNYQDSRNFLHADQSVRPRTSLANFRWGSIMVRTTTKTPTRYRILAQRLQRSSQRHDRNHCPCSWPNHHQTGGIKPRPDGSMDLRTFGFLLKRSRSSANQRQTAPRSMDSLSCNSVPYFFARKRALRPILFLPKGIWNTLRA